MRFWSGWNLEKWFWNRTETGQNFFVVIFEFFGSRRFQRYPIWCCLVDFPIYSFLTLQKFNKIFQKKFQNFFWAKNQFETMNCHIECHKSQKNMFPILYRVLTTTNGSFCALCSLVRPRVSPTSVICLFKEMGQFRALEMIMTVINKPELVKIRERDEDQYLEVVPKLSSNKLSWAAPN